MPSEHEFTKKVLSDEESEPQATGRKSSGSKKKQKVKKIQKKTHKHTVIQEDELAETYSEDEHLVLNENRKKLIDEDLRHIYSDGGELPDMTRFETKRQGSVVRAFGVLLLSLLFLAGVAWFGFFTFQPQARFSERDVLVSVNGPNEISIGEEVRYRIKYTNDQSVPLTQATVQVRYPAGFIFESSNIPAMNETNDTWQLGSIDPRDGGVIEIVGRLYGDIDTEQSLRVFFNYTPANFSSEFQKVESLRTLFTSSDTTIVVSGPAQLGVGALGSWDILLSGTEEETDLIIELELPDGFVISETQPATVASAPREWAVRTNATTTKLTVTGMFTENTPGSLGINAYIPLDTNPNNSVPDRVLISRTEQSISLTDTDVITNLLINGVMGNFGIQAGDVLNSTIVVRNAGDVPMENVSVRFVIDAPSDGTKTIYNWVALSDEADGTIVGEQRNTDTRRGIITWTSAQIPALRSLAPGAEVQIPFALPLLTNDQTDLTAFTTFSSAAVGEIQYMQGGTQQTATTNPIELTINSDLRFSVQHSISQNDATADVHRVVYILENSFHGLENIRVTTDLYGDITMGEFVLPAGNADFNEQTKTLTWTIDQMPLGVDVLPLQFTVTLNKRNPSQINLTSKVRIQARDVITGQTITIVGSEILLSDIVPDISA
jgi:uncharacterized repeat protein (TIGR01451 family)